MIENDMLPSGKLDFNKIERIGERLINENKFEEAIKFYVCLCDGDDYFEAGLYAYKLSRCFEGISDFHSAKYWAGRALEQNPEIERYIGQRAKFKSVGILDLVSLPEII